MIPKPVRQIGYSVSIYYIYYYTSKALGMLGVDALLGWVNEWIAMQFSNLEPSTVDVMQSIVPYVFPVLVVGILFAAFYYFDKVFEKAPPQITKTPAQSTIVAPDADLIPLPEAAKRAYEQLEEHGSSWKIVADRFGKTSNDESRADGAISYLECYFAFTRKVPLFGKHPPSMVERQVPFDELGRCGLEDGGNSLKYYYEKEPQYIELRVNWRDVKKVVDEMCNSEVREVALDALLNQPHVAPPEPEDRIPFIEFLKETARHGGIAFKETSHAINGLCQELRQAASDGTLEFYGKERAEFDPFLPIPKEHWYKFKIDWSDAVELIGENGKSMMKFSKGNFFVISRDSHNPNRKAYFDLHLNRSQAMKVLEDWKNKGTSREYGTTKKAFVKLQPKAGLLDVTEAINVTSVSDDGVGLITVIFDTPIQPTDVIEIRGLEKYEVLKRSPNFISLSLGGKDPSQPFIIECYLSSN